MLLNLNNGLLEEAKLVCSPNFDQRPHPDFVNALIIHAISLPPNIFGGDFVEAFFCNQLDTRLHPYYETIATLKVSSHFYIKRSGKLIQFVATQNRAWHAGQSQLKNLNNVNDFSIGIELEGCDELPFEANQYNCLIALSRALMLNYPAISKARIVGHCDISAGRKTDPGPCFDWAQFRRTL